jgi:hypothetical protein
MRSAGESVTVAPRIPGAAEAGDRFGGGAPRLIRKAGHCTAGHGRTLARMGTNRDSEEDDTERRATEKYVSDLLARGEAVYEGEEPTPHTTHVITRGDDGRLTVRRLRFLR